MQTVYFEEIDLNVEELEEVIAPALNPNHNETFVVDLAVEEMEEVVAPGPILPNHNETFARDTVELSVEELEETIAPWLMNHNEMLVSDATC